MDLKQKLVDILKENKTMKEELTMAKKLKEATDLSKDTQATPPQNAPASAGAALVPDGASKDVVKENEAKTDTQATPSGEPKASDGTQLTADQTSKDTVKEQENETPEMKKDEVKKEADEPMAKKPEEEKDVMKEQTGDMDMVVEVLEMMKAKIDELSSSVADLQAKLSAGTEAGVPSASEPMEPMEEKMNIKAIITDSIKGENKFEEAVKNVLY